MTTITEEELFGFAPNLKIERERASKLREEASQSQGKVKNLKSELKKTASIVLPADADLSQIDDLIKLIINRNARCEVVATLLARAEALHRRSREKLENAEAHYRQCLTSVRTNIAGHYELRAKIAKHRQAAISEAADAEAARLLEKVEEVRSLHTRIADDLEKQLEAAIEKTRRDFKDAFKRP